MKTLNSVLSEIKTCLDTQGKEDKEVKRNKKRLEFLYLMRNYLETSPTKEFVEKEIEKSENRVSSLSLLILPQPDGVDKKTYSRFRKTSENELGITKLRKQLKSLYFIRGK